MQPRRFSFLLSVFLVLEALALAEPEWTASVNRAQTATPNSPGTPTSSQPDSDKTYLAALEKQIAGRENKPAEEVFRNIQLFKGQPALRVLRVMEKAFLPGLGVSCTHCHVPDAWEKDDKEAKKTARTMWNLQIGFNTQIKEQVGRGVINCYTCHRGSTKPALVPSNPSKEAR